MHKVLLQLAKQTRQLSKPRLQSYHCYSELHVQVLWSRDWGGIVKTSCYHSRAANYKWARLSKTTEAVSAHVGPAVSGTAENLTSEERRFDLCGDVYSNTVALKWRVVADLTVVKLIIVGSTPRPPHVTEREKQLSETFIHSQLSKPNENLTFSRTSGPRSTYICG